MCADAWDSRDLSAVTYGIAGEMEHAACLPADPSSPCRRSSIRPEPLEADLSERHAQVVTLSSSSLATAASADLFHCNTQLLSYSLTKLHMADLPMESRAKKPVVSFRKWINDWNHTGSTLRSPAVCQISV